MRFDSRLRRFSIKAAYLLGEVPTLIHGAGVWAGLQTRRGDSFAQAQAITERSVVGKSLLAEEAEYFRAVVTARGLSPWALPFSFFRLPDGLERKLFGGLALEAAHRARLALVQTCLPPARRILDLGGAVDIHPEGALLAMGYPHRPEEVVVVDLPDNRREFALKGAKPKNMVTPAGTRVCYEYMPMHELSGFGDATFDMVWSGQSIEHVSEAEAEQVLAESFRVLRPGGYLCLDTPNRKLTRLISEKYLHPDHRLEYHPQQLAEKCGDAGFLVQQRLAVTPLPRSARLGRVSKLEVLQEARVGEDAESGFSFFLKCLKPA